MRLMIVAVGRMRERDEGALFKSYARRLPWPLEVKEIEVRGKGAGAGQQHEEGRKLLAAVPERALLVALDGRGEVLDSDGFARRLAGWRDDGTGTVAFVIGGADGLDPAVLQRASARLSLGAMTWPHLLVRTMLAEQLYRAASILQGHPYHRA